MRICFLADIRSIHTQKWITFFADKKNEIHLITLDYPEDPERVKDAEDYFNRQGIVVHKIKKSLCSLILSPIVVRQLISTIIPDIIHAHFVTHYGFLGAFSGKHPLIITAWGDDVLIHPKKSLIFRTMIKYSLKKADIITCDGENTEFAIHQLDGNAKKIYRIYFGIDTKKFNPEHSDKALFSKKFGTESHNYVIYLRGFDPVYSADTLIKSIPLVLEKWPRVIFLLAGGGEQMAKIQAQVEQSNFSSNVRFIGRIPNDIMPVYLATSDIYVSTSLSDSGIAASTAEAMACGVPPISTECGDIHSWIQDGVNGYIIERKNERILAERIIDLLQNELLRKQFGLRCRDIIVSRQDYYSEMNKMNEIYRQLNGEK